MLRATAIVRRPAVKADRVADTLTLDHEARHRRRVALTGEGGLSFLLDLDRATVLDDGDAVKLEDGRLVRIQAAPERLIEIRTDNPLRLMKVAWHIGNRHVAAELTADAIYIAHDHVLVEMIRGLGATATAVERPFRPERGAYHEHGPDCGHDHPHGAHDHGAHAHEHGGHDAGGHAHERHAHEHHGHGGACGCGHDHGHAHDHGGHGHGHEHPGHGEPGRPSAARHG
jgi:urease accessory protein